MSLAPGTPGRDNQQQQPPLTPGAIATQFSKLDLPAPTSLHLHLPESRQSKNIDPNSQPLSPLSPTSALSNSSDLSTTLAHLTFDEPEAVRTAREHKRKESVSEQMSEILSHMVLPQPERIFGPEDGANGGAGKGGKGKEGVSADEWDKVVLEDEVPEAVRSPTMTHSRNGSRVDFVKPLGQPTIPEGEESKSKSLPTVPAPASAPTPSGQEQKITPFDVQGGVDADGKSIGIDYDKLIREFGSTAITPELLARFEKLTGRRAHPLLRRGTFFSHREFNLILDRYEQGKPFYLYTGRGPSSGSMHMGHLIPFKFTAWLQEVFDVPLVIQMTDDEKFLLQRDAKKQVALEQNYQFGLENMKDIIACGFKPDKTFIFSDLDYMGGEFYKNVVKIARCITLSQSKNIFGFKDSDNVGMYHFAAIQSAPSFSNSFPHIFGARSDIPALIPCAIDQDPYFRLCRDAAVRLKYPKPTLLHAKFLPALQGAGTKMSASDANSALYMTDTDNQIKNKIRKAFSGGGATAEEHRRDGGRPEVDIAWNYLGFFVDDDEFMERLASEYRAGTLSAVEMKDECIKVMQAVVGEFRDARAKVTDDVVKHFMSVRPIDPSVVPRNTGA